MTQAVAQPRKQVMTIKNRLNSQDFRDAVAQVLPKHLTPERFTKIALLATMRTPKLLKCDQASLFQALMNLSQYGLEPDGRRAHLIPFENRKNGTVECQLIIDYKGLAELIMRSGLVTKIHADKVCENDDFEFDCGEVKRHRIDLRKPRGKAYAYYATVIYQGQPKADVMSIDEVDSVRKRSKAANNGPWVSDYDEMAKKTVFRRLSKWLPLSPQLRDAVEADDAAVGITDGHTGLVSTSTFEIEESAESLPEPQEEKAEAEAGLAPTPNQGTIPPRQIQEDLSNALDGVSFDDFRDFAVSQLISELKATGTNILNAGSFMELPTAFCEAAMKNATALARCVRTFRKKA